jgi:dephospho-CoA kinase
MDNYQTKITPFIIGLTGAIGTGKSLVRKMLEHKGALTIDADRLAHDSYAAGTKGFNELIRIFGNQILDRKGLIDRKLLGELVFNDSHALCQLESLIHPLVSRAIKQLIDLSPLPIIVIEAIKLLESDLYKQCNVIWEVTSHSGDIYRRLGKTRGMSRKNVDDRLDHQYFQKMDRSRIDKSIPNLGDIKTLWSNVSELWDDLANNSGSFLPALTETRELMGPFKKHLIQPFSDLHNRAVMEIDNRGLAFIQLNNLSFKNSFNLGEYSDPVRLKKNIIQYFLWNEEQESENIQYFIFDIENFSSTAAASYDRFDSEKFLKNYGLLQDFMRLHLCEDFYFLFNEDSTPLSNSMGFVRSNTSVPPDDKLSPLGYNLLYKQLRPPLDLFREK